MTKTRMTNARLKLKVAAIRAAKTPLRPLDQSLANDREKSKRTSENEAVVKAKLRAVRANLAYEAPRRDPIADRDIFEEIQESLRRGHIVSLTLRSPSPVIRGMSNIRETRKIVVPSKTILKEEKVRIKAGALPGIVRRRLPVFADQWRAINKVDRARLRRGELEKVIWVPHWDRTGNMLKGLAWAMAAYEHGGWVLTVNLGESVVEAAERDVRGFAHHLRERLKRELHRACGGLTIPVPEFFFVVEASELGTPHLHGAITLPDDRKHQDVIRTALYYASHGRSKKVVRTGREIHFKEINTPAIWANYAAKWWRGSEERIEGGTFACTTGLRALGKDWYQRMRETEAQLGGHESHEINLV